MTRPFMASTWNLHLIAVVALLGSALATAHAIADDGRAVMSASPDAAPIFHDTAMSRWDCSDIARLHGYVAVDRDAGVPMEKRMQDSVQAYATLLNPNSKTFGIEVRGAYELQTIIRKVYDSTATPGELENGVMQQCTQRALKPGEKRV